MDRNIAENHGQKYIKHNFNDEEFAAQWTIRGIHY